MKIYTKVVMDLEGHILEEESYEHAGKVAQCKGGQYRSQREAQGTAEKSYQLQLAQQEEERKRLEEMKALDSEKVANAALAAEKELEKKRKGTRSTILTDQASIGEPVVSKKSLYA